MTQQDDNQSKKKQLRVLDSASASAPAKTVMPEVLPDPRNAVVKAPPRARTLAHMQRLLATAAAVTVAAGGASACKKETKVPGESKGCGTKATEGGTSSGESSSGTGYAVVDPMPTPTFCPDIARNVTATAKVVDPPTGGLHLIVAFSKAAGRDDFKYVNDTPAVGYGVTIMKTEVTPDGIAVVTMKVDAPTATQELATTPHSVSVSVKGNCNRGPATLSASISWVGPLRKATPSIYVNEY